MPNTYKELSQARKNKNDEFYTQIDTIGKEINRIKEKLNNKIVYCNCDNPYESNIYKYLLINFNDLGLKQLLSSNYSVCNEIYKKPYKTIINQVEQLKINEYKNGEIQWSDLLNELVKNSTNIIKTFEHNGDFRNIECINMLKDADIIITNPPFSLFREHIDLIMKYNKNFSIIGNIMSVICKNVFPYIKSGEIFIAPTISGGDVPFSVPDHYPETSNVRFEDGLRIVRVKGVRWYSNIDGLLERKPLLLTKTYNENSYEKFDNYPNIINVNKTKDIPIDYYGVMGVPITFIDKFDKKEFRILEGSNRYGILDTWGKNSEIKINKSHGNSVNGKIVFARIHIQRIR